MDQGSIEPVGGQWNFDREYHKFCDILGLNAVKRQDSRMAERIYFIVKTLGGKSLNDKRDRLLKARKELGSNQLGELLVNDLWQVSRLKSDISLEKEQEKVVLKDKAKEAAERKAAVIEKNAREQMAELEKQIAQEKARQAELTDLTVRVQAVQGENYAST